MSDSDGVDWAEMVAAAARVHRQAVDKAEATRHARDDMIRRALEKRVTQMAAAKAAGLSHAAIRKINSQRDLE